MFNKNNINGSQLKSCTVFITKIPTSPSGMFFVTISMYAVAHIWSKWNRKQNIIQNMNRKYLKKYFVK